MTVFFSVLDGTNSMSGKKTAYKEESKIIRPSIFTLTAETIVLHFAYLI